MSFKIVGSGPLFPSGYEQVAHTAGEAIASLAAVRNLCGASRVYDANGAELSEFDLRQLKEREDDQARSRLRVR